MKKILSVLIVVLFGVTTVWAQGSVTINVTSNPTNGGTTAVRIRTATSCTATIWSWNDWQDKNYGYAVSYQRSKYSPTYQVGINYELTATANPGFYFVEWQGVPDCEKKYTGDYYDETIKTVTDNPFSAITKYVSSNIVYDVTALFAPVTVNSATDGVVEVNDIDSTVTGTVSFSVSGADDINDFELPIVTGTDFRYVSMSYNNNVVTVTVQYTSQTTDNVNGDSKPEYSASVTLTSKGGEAGAENKSQTATIKANISLVPTFTIAPTSYSFFEDYGIIANSESETKTLTVTTTNKAAAASAYTYSLSDAVSGSTTFSGASNPYTIDATNPLQPVVKFTAPANGFYEDIQCTLSINCTYTDAQFKQIVSETKTVTLTADAGSAIKINNNQNASHDFGTTIYGTGASTSLPFTATVAYTEAWDSSSIFTHSISGDKITVNVPADAVLGDYSSTLKFTYEGDVVATLAVSAQVRLAKPQIESKVYMSQVLLTWKNVYGAKQYILKSDETVIDISDVMTSEAIATASTSDSHTLSYSKMITAIGDVPLSTGTEYPFTLTVVYGDDVNNINDATKVSSTTITATPTVTTTITAGDVPLLGIYTGTEKADAYPYHKDGKRLVDLSAAFKDGKAIFDQLFIFGLTTGDASGNITKADASKGSNASTPCYIYVKDGNNYKLSSTIPNVNVKDRPSQFEIQVSGGKSYYFTGYSPYTSCGYQWEEAEHGWLEANGDFINGVFSFVGEKDVNLYFDNLQLYARPKSENGSLTVTQQVFEVNGIGDAGLLAREDLDGHIGWDGVNVKFYTQGSGSAFCFQPIKNGATLQPTIHLKGENILEPTQGVYLIVQVHFVIDFEKEASQHSAPIQVVHNKETIGTSTNLTIDDWWGGERTNGSLNLATQDSRPAPTIDLGSDKTTLNINGGQLFLSNSFNSSTEYDVSYAISYRMKSMLDGLAVIYGLGDDQPGATVLFNDGTINCKPLLSSNFNSTQGQKLFHNPTSMKCPQKTYIRGGSFNCDVLACSTTTSKGASPKNAENGDNLCLVTIPIDTLRANNTATLKPSWKTDVVDSLGAKPEANIIYNDGVHEGYDYYGIDCMTPQTITDKEGNPIPVVNLMLPSNSICFKEVLTTDWALCFPEVYVKAIEEKNLGGDIEVDYSISEDDGLTKVVKTSKFLYGELDQYMVNIVGGVSVDGENIKYSVPNEDGEASITISLPENGISKSVTNTQPFAVYDKMYMLMPLVANQWEMFVPPFDVANIYVVETYPEDKLIRDFDKNEDGKLTNLVGELNHEIDKARYAQSDRMMDLFYQWLWSVEILKSNADIWDTKGSLSSFMSDWLDLYKDLDSKPTTATCLQQLYHYHPTATYPSGKYWWDANFYLYQAVGDTWKYENGELQVKWEEVPTISQPRNTAGKHNVIMKKGQVYVMSFPSTIVNNKVYDYVNTWDYWTGKYIIIEGYPEEDVDTDGNDEPDDKAQMISGSEVDWQGNNISNTILAPYTADNSASLRGNSTFAKLDVSKIENAFVLNNYLRGKNASDDTDQDFGYGLVNSEYAHNVYVNLWESGFDADNEDPIHLSPGQGFILANFTAPMGMRAKAINLQSGEIAFGNEDSSQGTTTGVPTIAGNNKMLVYTMNGGVGIVPVVAQQVSIYNAAGQLITSQYLTEEVQIPLPAGIYLISGENEMAKAVVR